LFISLDSGAKVADLVAAPLFDDEFSEVIGVASAREHYVKTTFTIKEEVIW